MKAYRFAAQDSRTVHQPPAWLGDADKQRVADQRRRHAARLIAHFGSPSDQRGGQDVTHLSHDDLLQFFLRTPRR